MNLDPNGFNMLKQCRYGPMLFNKLDWPIGTSLIHYGEYAMDELRLLEQLIRPDNLVVDAGANIGTHTVWFSKLAQFVVSFEPQRIAYQTLCANVALNNCLNVHAFHAAVGKEKGSILVPVRDQYKPNNFGGVPLAGTKEGEMTEMMAIDDLHLVRCDLIKADVEGMEEELLIGAKNTIAKFRPILYMEADGAEATEAIRHLMGIGYVCYWSIPNLYSPHNFEQKHEDIFLSASGSPLVSINMLCLPIERNIIVEGMKRIESPTEQPALQLMCYDSEDPVMQEYINQIKKKIEEKELENV